MISSPPPSRRGGPTEQPSDAAPPSPPTLDAVLGAVLDVSRESAAATSRAAVADSLVRVAARLLGADQGTVGLVRDGEVITIAALLPPRQPVGSHFPVGFGVAGWVAATGRSAEIADVRQDRRYVALPYPEVRSFLGLPLQVGESVEGVLSLAAWRDAAFAEGTAEALRPLAEHAALLLRHAALDEAAGERLSALEAHAEEGLAEALHELKAPLHAAAGFLDILADEQVGPLNAQQRDFLATARGECERLKEAIATLVEVGASGTRRAPRLEVADPARLVASAVQRLRGQALARGVRLVEEVDVEARTVRADQAAILQVLANLVQNALRVVPSGSEVVLATTSLPGWTCFMVADRGPGLPSGEAEAIFERFRQGAGRERERRAGEVGLGLALSRRIVEQHQGMIWAENREGGGSRFCFALPVATP